MKTDIINIENMIYEIRGEYVMLDSDLAKVYKVETKRINEAVKRNILKFPYNYSFVMSVCKDYCSIISDFQQIDQSLGVDLGLQLQ